MATVDVLVEGYARSDGEASRVAGTVSLVRAPGFVAIVDPDPGHTPQDITTLVETDDGVIALTHLWWHTQMEGDPRATDLDALHAGRARVLEVARRIVPGHGPAFEVADATSR